MSTIKDEKDKVLRATILDLLRDEYPSALDVEVIRATLVGLMDEALTKQALEQNLHYMHDKGHLKLTKRGAGDHQFSYAVLTPLGWDIASEHTHSRF